MREEPDYTFVPAAGRTPDARHRIVIVGGGAGGLELAVRLGDDLGRRQQAEVVLVDPMLTHLWKPLLHEVAAGTLMVEENGLDFLQQARRHHFHFHLGTLTALDRGRKEIGLAPLVDETGQEIAPARSLWYDTLVIAIGSRDNDFGIPGVREHALPLNGPDDALRFHRRLLALLARAEMLDYGPVRVIIVGGGATGVELAAELHEATREIASYGARLRRFEQPVEITVIDGAPRLLAALPEAVARKAGDDLRDKGVRILLQRRVTEVRNAQVVVTGEAGNETLDADIVVWAAGIRAPDVLANLDGLETNRLNQLVVGPTLQCTRDDAVFAMGDCASVDPGPGAAPVPPKAQAAHQQARLLARSLRRQLEGEPLLRFEFHDRGSLISLGQHEAVGNVQRDLRGHTLLLEGVLARFSYWLLYRRHLATLLGYARTVVAVVGAWLSGRVQPRVKLH